jgi:hypothetical protein
MIHLWCFYPTQRDTENPEDKPPFKVTKYWEAMYDECDIDYELRWMIGQRRKRCIVIGKYGL